MMYALAGDWAWALRVFDWVSKKSDRHDPRDFGVELGAACMIAIDERRRVLMLSNTLMWMPVREKIFAFGAGHEFAWGALEAGATARRAIEIAAKRSDYAALGVDCMEWK